MVQLTKEGFSGQVAPVQAVECRGGTNARKFPVKAWVVHIPLLKCAKRALFLNPHPGAIESMERKSLPGKSIEGAKEEPKPKLVVGQEPSLTAIDLVCL